MPEFRVDLELDATPLPANEPFEYVREAINKYWSDGDVRDDGERRRG